MAIMTQAIAGNKTLLLYMTEGMHMTDRQGMHMIEHDCSRQ